MIKAIILSFIGITYSFEITITKDYIYQEYSSLRGEDEKRYTIYDLSTSKTHVIESDKKGRRVYATAWHKDNWVGQSKSLKARNTMQKLAFHGLDCIMLEEVWSIDIPKSDSIESIYYSYQCNFDSLLEYLDLDPTTLNVLPQFKNTIESHPFEVARWTMYPTGKFDMSPPLKNIVYTEMQNYDFIEKLLMIELVKDK